jgi:hypothetical protein
MDEKVPTFEEMMALFAETRASIAETAAEAAKRSAELDEQLAKTDAKIDKLTVDIDKMREELGNIGHNQVMFTESEKLLAETQKQMAATAKQIAENDEKFANMREELGNIGHNNGLVAEEIVYHSLEKDRVFAGIQFDFIDHGLQPSKKLPDGKKIKGEYDVFLKNGSAVAIIEVKHRVGQEALERLITVQLPRFKLLYPEYKDFKMYLGLGGMSFAKGVAEEAHRQGIATLTLSGDAVEINDKDVKAW